MPRLSTASFDRLVRAPHKAQASGWLNLLVTLALVTSGCSDLPLPRGSADVASDTVPEAPSLPKGPSSRRAGKVASINEREGFARVRGSLRRLVAAQENFYAENGSYTEDLSLIGFRPEPNTTVRFLWITRDGWAASGMHSGMPGKDCVVFVGKAESAPTTLKYIRVGREGVTVCDDSSSPSRPAAPAPRPEPTATPPLPDTGSVLSALDPRTLMKVDLRNLARSQETYLATQGVYARRTQPLAIQYLWRDGVDIRILAANRQSWSARATHVRFPGRSCVIWFGPVSQRPVTDAQRRQSPQSGVPVCDD
jgi:hypothetical protein